jgi:hypothetical protein
VPQEWPSNASPQQCAVEIQVSNIIIRLLGTGAAPNSTSLTRPCRYDLEASRRIPPKSQTGAIVIGTIERAPLASYFLLALVVSRTLVTKASNRGSL